MRRATPTMQHGRGAAFTLALGIPTMRASAAMHHHAGSGCLMGDSTGGAGDAAAVWPGPATGLAVIEFEMFRGRLRLSGPGALRSTTRGARVDPIRAQRPSLSRPDCNPPLAASTSV